MSQFRLRCLLMFSCFLVASTIQARLFRTGGAIAVLINTTSRKSAAPITPPLRLQ